MRISAAHMLAGGLLTCLLGCGQGSSVPQPELERASQAVQTMLDVWKSGAPLAKMKALQPPLSVTEPDWQTGFRLLEYTLKSAEGQPNRNVRCPASLTLQHRGGQKMTKEVMYDVNLGDNIVIARDPFF